MIEVWLQVTCDGCGTTTNSEMPNSTKSEFREDLKECGWQSVGLLNYCRSCVKIGNARRRVTGFESGAVSRFVDGEWIETAPG